MQNPFIFETAPLNEGEDNYEASEYLSGWQMAMRRKPAINPPGNTHLGFRARRNLRDMERQKGRFANPIFDSRAFEAFESEFEYSGLENESGGGGKEYAKWVQRSLNKLMGASLTVDGIIGEKTREVIRSFQMRQSIFGDGLGIVGKQTEAALILGTATVPPSAPAPSIPGGGASAAIDTPLPRSGPGFYGTKSASRQYGLAGTIRALESIGAAWHSAHPGGPRIAMSDISFQGGGPMPPHKSHQKGVDIDIRLMRNDGKEAGTRYQDPSYSRALTQELVNMIRANPVLSVRTIYFNDPLVTGVSKWPGHDDHLHVRFCAPGDSSCIKASQKEFEYESFDYQGEFADEYAEWESESGSALDVLSPTELKAVRITSTFETGRAGGFGGLTGNFDGQGLSFGLLNFTVKAGSLIPLLQEFIEKHAARYAAIFGKDAAAFKDMVFASKPDPKNPKRRTRDVDAQMEFVNKRMNAIPGKARGNRIIEPWKSYFGKLENDTEFRKIQVKAVRKAIDRAKYWFDYFGFKTERGFAFMFDLVSSHGGAWLNAPKFKGKRRLLLQNMLEAKKKQTGREALSELEKMEAIANMIADVSLPEWREKVRIRKLWFVKGIGKVHGTIYDIKKDFSITDNPPNFGAGGLPGKELEWEYESGYGEFEEYESPPGSPSAPALIAKESLPPGQTMYLNIKLGAESPARAMTGVYIPAGFRSQPKIDVIIYLHGIKTSPYLSISRYWNAKYNKHFALREGLNAAAKNAILIAPTLGPKSQWQTGWLTKPGGLDKYLGAVLQALAAYGPFQNSRPEIGNIILACHSGGGHPMRELALAKNNYSPNIKECWGFDCTYYDKDIAGWPEWARKGADKRLYLYYRPNSKTQPRALKIRDAGLPNISILTSNVGHNWVPIKHWQERLQGTNFLK